MTKKSNHTKQPHHVFAAEEEDELEAEKRALKQAMADGVLSKLGLFNKNLLQNDDDEEMKDEDSEDEEEGVKPLSNSKAAMIVATDLIKSRSHLPWSETLSITSLKPLPFGGDEGSPQDIHDDLKRELAFYNTALDAVLQARVKCEQHQIPFARPDDFFAEMIKSDGTEIVFYVFGIPII